MTSVTNYATTDYSTYGLLVSQSGQVKSRLDTLTEQVSTGLVSTVFSGLGGTAASALNLSNQVTEQQAQIKNISTADASLTLTQSMLTQIGSIAQDFYAQTNTLSSASSSDVDAVAANARNALTQLAGLLNTRSGDNYIFGGSDAGQPPVPDATNILTSGFYTDISSAVQGLSANGAATTTASTLATAASDAAGTSPFSIALSQPAGSVNADLPAVDIGNGQRLTIGIAAGSNVAAVSGGSSTTGSYIRDLLRSLATVGALSSSQASDTGFADLVSDTHASLGGAVAAIADEQGILGNTQTRIDNAGTLLTAANTALTSQISNIQDVDIAAVSTQLTQTQANLQASYKLIADLSDDSLLKYL